MANLEAVRDYLIQMQKHDVRAFWCISYEKGSLYGWCKQNLIYARELGGIGWRSESYQVREDPPWRGHTVGVAPLDDGLMIAFDYTNLEDPIIGVIDPENVAGCLAAIFGTDDWKLDP